jgi:molybdate transport system substrate-binding protein
MGHLATLIAITAVAMCSGAVSAAEVKLVGSPGVRGVIEQLAPKFQAKTGHTVVGDFEVIAKIKSRIERGEDFDIAVLSPEALASLIADKKVDRQELFARAGMGVGFRKGTTKPDVSTAEALKKTLLAARSVVYSQQGLSGRAYLAVIERLGIGSEMQGRARASDTNIVEAVATGSIELVVTSISTMALNKGVELAGPLPAELQQYVVFNAGVSSNAAQKGAAEQFLEFAKNPEVAQLSAAAGLER